MPKIILKKPKILNNSWSIESHTEIKNFDPKNMGLYTDPEQEKSYVKGTVLQERLKGKNVLNASVLDWLLEHPEHIPTEWREKYIFFWGTIYRYSESYLCVRYLCWHDGQWGWRHAWLGSEWDVDYSAAVLASSGIWHQ